MTPSLLISPLAACSILDPYHALARIVRIWPNQWVTFDSFIQLILRSIEKELSSTIAVNLTSVKSLQAISNDITIKKYTCIQRPAVRSVGG